MCEWPPEQERTGGGGKGSNCNKAPPTPPLPSQWHEKGGWMSCAAA
jgi:hypothetical protein